MSPASSEPSVKYTRLEQRLLHFDPTNPRFARPDGSFATEDQIQSLLEKEPHVALELVDSFLENGYIAYEPLVVRERDAGGFLVVEGNRRLAAIRHIQSNKDRYAKRSTKISDLDSIPVLIFPKTTEQEDQKQQRVYLGVRHLFGFRDWPADSKARFLDAQIKSKDDLDRTRRELNIKKHEVSRYLIPFRLKKKVKAVWEPHKDQDFWVLGESLNRSGIKQYIGLIIDKDSLDVLGVNQDRLKKLLTFIYGTPESGREDRRINETRDLSDLARVLESKEARAALEGGSTLEESSVLIETPDETFARLKRLLSELHVVIGVMKKRPGFATLVSTFKAFDKATKSFIRDAQKPRI